MSTRAAVTEHARNSVEFVRIGFNDCCIFFTVGFYRHDFADFRLAVKAAGQYNNFDPRAVLKAFDKIADSLDRVYFGREGSPVMYLKVEHSEDPAEIERRLVAVEAAFGRGVEVDEMDRAGTRTLRCWWD
jgi:hypothetical protein